MKQKVLGILLLLICVGIVVLAANGTALEEKDITAVLILAPIGMYALTTKEKPLPASTTGKAASLAHSNVHHGA